MALNSFKIWVLVSVTFLVLNTPFSLSASLNGKPISLKTDVAEKNSNEQGSPREQGSKSISFMMPFSFFTTPEKKKVVVPFIDLQTVGLTPIDTPPLLNNSATSNPNLIVKDNQTTSASASSIVPIQAQVVPINNTDVVKAPLNSISISNSKTQQSVQVFSPLSPTSPNPANLYVIPFDQIQKTTNTAGAPQTQGLISVSTQGNSKIVSPAGLYILSNNLGFENQIGFARTQVLWVKNGSSSMEKMIFIDTVDLSKQNEVNSNKSDVANINDKDQVLDSDSDKKTLEKKDKKTLNTLDSKPPENSVSKTLGQIASLATTVNQLITPGGLSTASFNSTTVGQDTSKNNPNKSADKTGAQNTPDSALKAQSESKTNQKDSSGASPAVNVLQNKNMNEKNDKNEGVSQNEGIPAVKEDRLITVIKETIQTELSSQLPALVNNAVKESFREEFNAITESLNTAQQNKPKRLRRQTKNTATS